MEVKFENTTKYSKKMYDDFLKFHINSYFNQIIIETILIAVVSIYIIICNIIFKNWTLILLIIICLIAFSIYIFYKEKKTIKKEVNSSKIVTEEEFIFKFYSKKFTINTQKEIEQVRYKKIYKAFETEKYFYLYINKTQAFILDKKGFDKNSYSEFRKFLKNILKRKFKI